MPTKYKIIIGLLIAALIGGAVYFNLKLNAEKQKTEPQLAASGVLIPMRILINTSAESSPTIDGEVFTPGEWRHVSEEWFQKNVSALQEYPDLKEARVILEEKLQGVPEGEMKKVIEENHLQNFAQGLKDAAALYNQPMPAIANEILKIKPYVK